MALEKHEMLYEMKRIERAHPGSILPPRGLGLEFTLGPPWGGASRRGSLLTKIMKEKTERGIEK
jgi:hypothetical protein